MDRLGRFALITCIALFLEGFALFLGGRLLANAIRLPDAAIPLWVAAVAMGWAFILSWYVQTIRFSLNLRGVVGLILSAVSVLALAGLSLGLGWFPIGRVLSGDIYTIAALGLATLIMLALWWRGTAIARDDVTLDVIRNAFIRGVVVVMVAAAADPLMNADIVGIPLLLTYFAIGLTGLALSRFTSEDATGHMSRGWIMAIAAGIGGVLLVAVILGALGVGGLDDVARAIMRGIGWMGLWVLRPILLLLGLLAAAMVAFGNWVSGFFGGGDLTGLELARTQIQEFHESLRDVEGSGPPNFMLTLLKWLAFLVAVALAGWVLFRMFRRRRLIGGVYAEGEVRESLFSWQGAGQDISDTLADWMNRVANVRRRRPPPVTPREVYHRLLEVASNLGLPRRQGQTPQEHRQDVAGTLPDPPVEHIVDGFQRYYYGAGQDDNESETMTSLLNDLDDVQTRS